MSNPSIESQSTEKLMRSLRIIRWLLPVLVTVAVLSLGVLFYKGFIDTGYRGYGGLMVSSIACLGFSNYFFRQRKMIRAELDKRNG